MKASVIAIAIFFALIPAISANNLPNGLVFRVIVNDLNERMETDVFNEFQPVNYIQTDQNYTYELGAYKDFIQVQKAKNEVKTIGFQKVDIVAYFNHRQVSLDDAFVLMDNKNSAENKSLASVSDRQIDEMLSKVEKPDFYYTVQIGVFNAETANNFFDFPKTIDEKIVTRGYDRYTYGEYYTIGDAKTALKMLKEYGMSNAFIIAYDELERIPLARAIDMEQKFLHNSLASE